MINKRDVVTVKMPFPDIDADLAVYAHMYICRQVEGDTVHLVKCQTLKPYMLVKKVINHYWDEEADIARNPFQKKTRIDCDKEFVTCHVQYHDRMKAVARPDVCEDVMTHVEEELLCDGYASHTIAENDLLTLNRLLQPV